ncbi:MAG TPA: DUF302 domain-containing protein [Rhodocyclaceae bacterium]|nr:DUF302 domain-containing protein [Rhodocyclaceae bacterium]
MNIGFPAPSHVRRGAMALCLGVAALSFATAAAQPVETRSMATTHGFAQLLERLEGAVAANGMAVVAAASASRGAAARGITIPGNAVVMVFRNDYAVRMLEASVPAGIEAPLRFYVTENADGTATLSWRAPSSVFAPYGSAALDAMAAELDAIFETIADDAAR